MKGFNNAELYWIYQWAVDELQQQKEALASERKRKGRKDDINSYKTNVKELKSIIKKTGNKAP